MKTLTDYIQYNFIKKILNFVQKNQSKIKWQNKVIKHSIILIIISLFITGCVSTGLNKEDYNNRLSQVELGMTKSEFRKIFPETIPRGAKQYVNGSVEVLEILYSYYSFMPTGNQNRNGLTGMEGQPQWFYFYNNQLVQYGNPNDWPKEPDLIIEKRIKYVN